VAQAVEPAEPRIISAFLAALEDAVRFPIAARRVVA